MNIDTVYTCVMAAVAVAALVIALTKGVEAARQRSYSESVIQLYVRWASLLAAGLVAPALQIVAKGISGEVGRALSASIGLAGGICAIVGVVTFIRLYRAVKSGNTTASAC